MTVSEPHRNNRITSGYIRVSTPRQAEEGYSLDAQERQIRAYCEAHRLPGPTNIYREEGHSGATKDRPAFKELIKDCEEGIIGRVVVVDLSRVARDGDYLWFFRFAERTGIEWCSIAENFDTSSAVGRAVVAILMAVYRLQREQMLEKVTSGMTERALQGLWNPPGPYGYTYIPKEESSNGDGELIVNEAEAVILKAVAERYAHGEPLVPICREFGLNSSTIHYLFTPERVHVYRGLVPVREHEYNWETQKLESSEKRWVRGRHERILSDETVELVLARKERQGTCPARHPPVEYLRCGVCGRRFYMNRDRHGNPIVVCEHAPVIGAGEPKSLQKSLRLIDRAGGMALDALLHSEKLHKAMLKVVNAKATEAREELQKEQARTGRSRSRIEERLEKLLTLYEDGGLTAEQYKEKAAPLEAEKAGLETVEVGLADKAKFYDRTKAELAEALELLKDIPGEVLWDEMSEGGKRSLLAEWLTRALIYRDRIIFEPRKMPALCLHWSEARKFNTKKKGHKGPKNWWALRDLNP
ncbi:MAG: recombinase family protein [Actinomycetota bacterium]